MLLLKTDDLLARRAETVGRVLDFIGVNSKVHLRLDFEAHRSSEKLEKTRALAFARRSRSGVSFHHRFDGVFGNYWPIR